MPTVKRGESSTQRSTYTISNPTKTNPAYRSIHRNYEPFLNYIRNHADIDDATVERAERKFGGMSSSSSSSSNSNGSSGTSASVVGIGNFRDQASVAAQKKQERDDARHADLHANYKHGSYADEDKIFLLKREIDSLRGQLRESNGGGGKFTRSFAMRRSGTNNAFTGTSFSVLLVVCLLLVAARTIKRRIAGIRSANSLLDRAEAEAARSTGVSNTTVGSGWFELSASSGSAPSSSSMSSSWVPPASDDASTAQISFL